MTRKCAYQPVSSVAWVPRSCLRANDYNPNRVAPPELKLLAISIMEDGWTQPIVVRQHPEEKGVYEVVDGYHRYLLAADPEIAELTDGLVPVVMISKGTLADQMISTIRHNRARGTHGVRPMAEIVRELVNTFHLPEAEICHRLGMEDEEVERLYDHAGMPERVSRSKTEFSKGWKPTREEPVEDSDGPGPASKGKPFSRRSV